MRFEIVEYALMKSFLRLLRDLSISQPSIPLPDEIHLPALEKTWAVTYRETGSRSVQARCNGSGVLSVHGNIKNREMVVSALKRWLSRQAKSSLVPWLNDLGAQSGLSYNKVAVRGQKTRWASCSFKGNINLNFRLLFLPADVVRYILNHELCHTVHPNHSESFWLHVASLEPEYRKLNSLARRGMDGIPEWAKGEGAGRTRGRRRD